MKVSPRVRAVALFAALCVAAVCVAGCGGGSSGGTPPGGGGGTSPLQITTTSLPAGLTGQSYQTQIKASGGVAPYTWAIASGSLPNGINLDTSGVLSGTPVAKGTFNITVQVQDSVSRTASQSLSISVTSGLAIVTTSLPQGTWYKPYTSVMQGAGGVAPYQWSLASGSGPLPSGITLGWFGAFNGTTTAAGTYNITVQLQDGLGDTATKQFSLVIVNSLVVTSGVLPIAIAGQPYTTQLQAAGGTGALSWDLPPGSFPLPDGLTLSTSGLLSGTVNSSSYGTFSVQARVSDATGATDTANLLLSVAQPLQIVTTTLADGNVGIQYFQGLSGSGGLFGAGFQWSLASGSGPLPPGLNLSQYGLLAGTPTAPGTFPITVELRDLSGQDVTRDLSLLIKNDVVVTSSTLQYGIVNQPYQDILAAVGGTPPYTWSATGLPAGLSASSSGGVSGAPAQDGTFVFSVQATDSSVPKKMGTANVTVLVRTPLHIVAATLPDGVTSRPYYFTLVADGGHYPPYTVQVSSGQLPGGVNISSSSDYSGNISINGAPTAVGSSDFTVQVSDSASPPLTATANFSIRVNSPLSMNDLILPSLIEGQTVDASASATGGASPYTWSMTSGPPGVTIDPATGHITGTPSQAFFGFVSFQVHDSANPPQNTSRTVYWQIYGRMKALTSFWPPIVRGDRAVLTPSFTGGGGGIGPFTMVLSGTLPPGMQFDASNGTIYGIPTASGDYPLTVTESDGGGPLGQTASAQWTLSVKDPGQAPRNETLGSATPLSNGSVVGAISPYADPNTPGPDVDVYRVTANPGALVSVSVISDVHWELPVYPGSSPMFPVVEILDSTGARTQSCQTAYNGPFNAPCVSGLDGNFGGSVGLAYQVPGSGTTPATLYIRVLDARGDARPDLVYTLNLSGVN